MVLKDSISSDKTAMGGIVPEKLSFHNREESAKSLLEMIRPLKKYYTPDNALLSLGHNGVHYGSKAAAIEGFARVLWGLGPLLAAKDTYRDQAVRMEIREWRQRILMGMAHGTDPHNPCYWGEMQDFDQRIVEAASIILLLLLNRDIWTEMAAEEKTNLYEWLNAMNRCDMPRNNWRFFRLLTNRTFQLLELPFSEARIAEDKEVIEHAYLGNGWYYDGGREKRDYYIAFAFHFYGLIYSVFMSEADSQYAVELRRRAEHFAGDYIQFFAADGSTIPYGRSLTYRFAHYSFWSAYVFAGCEAVDPGMLRSLFTAHMQQWTEKPIFAADGVLSVGYGYPNLVISEHYNAGGSPYWAFKTFLVLALPEEHAFWKRSGQVPDFQKKTCIPEAGMILCHGTDGSVAAYPAGQHCPGNHGNVAEKYEKFVYSNKFGFSISRGTKLNDGAFDNTIAFSHGGEDRYTMMYGADEACTREEYLAVRYRPIAGVEAESIIVPLADWHVRIHRIRCDHEINAADCGFSINMENDPSRDGWEKYQKYDGSQGKVKAREAFVELPWGCTGIFGDVSGVPEIIQCFPNTNVLHKLTVMPVMKYHLTAGQHLICDCIYGRYSENYDSVNRPECERVANGMRITYKDQIIFIAIK